MLLLYILWDDWPIFMISALNEQLQQQLEYTLLKPDCHSWWISKMQSLEERHAVKFCFKLGKNATETYGMLQTAFWSSCMNRAWVFEWHKRFQKGRESVRDDERCERSKEVNTPELIGQRFRVRVTMLRFIYYILILILNWIVWIRAVWLNWMAWNRNVFHNETVLKFKLRTYARLNCLKWNCFWHWNCTYTKLNNK